MDAGADSFMVKPVDVDELHARLLPARRIIELQNGLLEQNRAAKRDSQRMYIVSRIDALTSLRNRRALEDDLPAIVSEAKRYHRPCSCAMFDIDEFKLCNDTFGHLAGDDVLRRVADTLRAEFRRSDVVYRYGGEELFVVLPEQTSGTAAAAVERGLRAVEALGLPHSPNASHRVITVSAGIAELRGSAQNWIARADAALYLAKRAGRNRVVIDSEVSS
jgi:diguanylate cyclase (GGDEF)-like protein